MERMQAEAALKYTDYPAWYPMRYGTNCLGKPHAGQLIHYCLWLYEITSLDSSQDRRQPIRYDRNTERLLYFGRTETDPVIVISPLLEPEIGIPWGLCSIFRAFIVLKWAIRKSPAVIFGRPFPSCVPRFEGSIIKMMKVHFWRSRFLKRNSFVCGLTQRLGYCYDRTVSSF